MATVNKADSGEITIMEVTRKQMEFCVLGVSPLILNRMSQKVWFELLAPKGKKTAADKASTLKHIPPTEFRDSVYRMPGDDAPTLLALLPTMFKRAMGTAALDMPGAKRAQILRNIYAHGEFQPVFGIPKLFMAITRSADIARTPDVRTRAILPEWACRITISFPTPLFRDQSIINLLAAAGFQSGVGDWRQEKGSGSFGSFELVAPDHPDFVRITSTQGRAAQQEALANPVPYNIETAEMLSWFGVEVKRRGFDLTSRQIIETAPKDSMGKLAKAMRKNGDDPVGVAA